MSPAGAMALTGGVFVVACIFFAAWVSDESRGAGRRRWHRPLVASLGGVAGVLFIVAAWMAVEVPA